MRNVFSLLCAREKYYYSIRKCQMLHSSTSEYRTQYATALRGVPTPQRVEALRYTVPLGNLPNLLVLMSVPRAVFVCTLRPAIEELSTPYTLRGRARALHRRRRLLHLRLLLPGVLLVLALALGEE